jgi:hypothetical protein
MSLILVLTIGQAVRYFAGQLPGLFALPAGIGDLVTGLLRPSLPMRGIAVRPMRAAPRSHGMSSA